MKAGHFSISGDVIFKSLNSENQIIDVLLTPLIKKSKRYAI